MPTFKVQIDGVGTVEVEAADENALPGVVDDVVADIKSKAKPEFLGKPAGVEPEVGGFNLNPARLAKTWGNIFTPSPSPAAPVAPGKALQPPEAVGPTAQGPGPIPDMIPSTAPERPITGVPLAPAAPRPTMPLAGPSPLPTAVQGYMPPPTPTPTPTPALGPVAPPMAAMPPPSMPPEQVAFEKGKAEGAKDVLAQVGAKTLAGKPEFYGKPAGFVPETQAPPWGIPAALGQGFTDIAQSALGMPRLAGRVGKAIATDVAGPKAGEIVGAIAGNHPTTLAAKYLAKNLVDPAAKFYENAQGAQADAALANAGIGEKMLTPGWAARQVARNAPQLAVGVGSALSPMSIQSLFLPFVLEAGETQRELEKHEKERGPISDARFAGATVLKGGVGAAMERVGGEFILGKMAKYAPEGIRKALGEVGTEFATAIFGEPATEAMQEVNGNIAKMFATDPPKDVADLVNRAKTREFWAELGQGVPDAAVAAVLLAGLASGPRAAVAARAEGRQKAALGKAAQGINDAAAAGAPANFPGAPPGYEAGPPPVINPPPPAPAPPSDGGQKINFTPEDRAQMMAAGAEPAAPPRPDPFKPEGIAEHEAMLADSRLWREDQEAQREARERWVPPPPPPAEAPAPPPRSPRPEADFSGLMPPDRLGAQEQHAARLEESRRWRENEPAPAEERSASGGKEEKEGLLTQPEPGVGATPSAPGPSPDTRIVEGAIYRAALSDRHTISTDDVIAHARRFAAQLRAGDVIEDEYGDRYVFDGSYLTGEDRGPRQQSVSIHKVYGHARGEDGRVLRGPDGKAIPEIDPSSGALNTLARARLVPAEEVATAERPGPSPDRDIVPERAEDLAAQRDRVAAGTKPSIWYPAESLVDGKAPHPLPDGMVELPTEDGGIAHYNPERVADPTVLLKPETRGRALGMMQDAKPESGTHVVTTRDAQGREILSEVATAENVDAVKAHHEAQAQPGDTVTVEAPGDVLAARQGKAPTQPARRVFSPDEKASFFEAARKIPVEKWYGIPMSDGLLEVAWERKLNPTQQEAGDGVTWSNLVEDTAMALAGEKGEQNQAKYRAKLAEAAARTAPSPPPATPVPVPQARPVQPEPQAPPAAPAFTKGQKVKVTLVGGERDGTVVKVHPDGKLDVSASITGRGSRSYTVEPEKVRAVEAAPPAAPEEGLLAAKNGSTRFKSKKGAEMVATSHKVDPATSVTQAPDGMWVVRGTSAKTAGTPPTSAAPPAAGAAAPASRATHEDGRWVPRAGDDVYLDGQGGMGLTGKVYARKDGTLAVKEIRGRSVMGGGYTGPKTAGLDTQWTVSGDPRPAELRAEEEAKKKARADQIDAEQNAYEAEGQRKAQEAIKAGDAPVTP
ncbi:MAG: hypothetical protein WCK05_07900, partial [Planctomycetota bacterium]